MKKNCVLLLTSAMVIASSAIFFLPEALAATTYALTSPIPAVVNDGTVSEGVSTASSRVMWRSPDGQVHLFSAFGDSPWYSNYVNMTTGEHALISGTGGDARMYAYHPIVNKLYITGKYHATLSEFDPVTRTLRVIKDIPSGGSVADLNIGDDNKVYWNSGSNHVYSYDPSVGLPSGLKDYGVAISNPYVEYGTMAIDSGYIYLGCKKADGTWSLSISPTSGSPNWSEWKFGSAGDTSMSISKQLNSSNWQLARTLSDGSHKYYLLHDGTYTEIAGVQGEYHHDRAPNYCAVASSDDPNTGYHPAFFGTYGWDTDFTDLFPIKSIHEFSLVGYRHSDSGVFTYSQVPFTGPWLPQSVEAVVPLSGNNVLGLSSGYNAAIDLNYISKSPNYLGGQQLSPYAAMRYPSGDIYGAGYANQLFRYNPNYPWTLTNSNRTPKSGAPDPTWAVNPYFIDTSSTETWHYRSCLDYDADGLVWVGANTTRGQGNTSSFDIGSVMWYNPSDGTTGYLFQNWANSPGNKFGNLIAADNRSKILVSSSGNIWVVNAATKAVDPTPIVPLSNTGRTYMVEVAPDVVLGVVIAPPNYKIFRFKPSTKQILTPPQDLGVPGIPFGWSDAEAGRRNYKLELGPDGFVWMFAGNSLYRINPDTLQFNKVLDTPYAKIKFAANNTDLLLYGNGTDFKYIPGILKASQTFASADLNEDSKIDATDLNILKSDFLKLAGSLTNSKSDIDGDGQATIKDVGILMSGWKS